MTDIADNLLRRADATPPGDIATVVQGGQRVSLGVTSVGPMAIAFTELRLVTERLKGASIDRVRGVAESLTARVTYLLEPLTPIEIDQELAVVQMRSTTPQADRESSAYYELLVKAGGSLSLRRYRKPRGALREPIDATVTREVLKRLVGDFVESVG